MMSAHLRRVASWLYVAALMLAVIFSIFRATPQPQDDHFLYQAFVEALARGSLDLTIPGFHGSDIFAVPWYWISHSSIAQIQVLQVWAILLPLFGFLAGRALYKSDWHGIVFASIVTLMPFVSFVAMRGWTGPAYWGLMLLTIYASSKRSKWTGVAWALAMLTKPFAIVLAPLIFLQLQDSKKSKNIWRTYHPFLVTGGIVLAYFLLQYLMAGRIFVGAHTDMGATTTVQGPLRIALNLAHSLQILFSVHNYYYPNPAQTGPGNMMHTTPVLIFLGLFAMLSPRTADAEPRLMRALLIGAVFGIAMNALLDHMDHFYMEASVLLFILAALPMLKKFPLWIPIALATLHFQWFYFYLQFGGNFALDTWFFIVPGLIDAIFLVWCLFQRRQIWAMLRASFV